MKFIFTFLALFLIEQVSSKSDRIKLKDVQVLTLKKGKYTEARRSRRVHQLMCVGGTARCSYIPETVQCYNRGWDGTSVNWECKADMDKKYSFGLLEVTCEGYDHPDDSYILAGSCGLEFTINVADGAPRQRNFNPPPYPKSMTPDDSDLGSQSIFFIILVFGALFFIIYLFRSPPGAHEPSAPPPPPGFRSDFFGNPPPYDAGSGPSCGSETRAGNSPGFGTGFFSGGLLGYLWGRNSAGPSYTRTTYSSSDRRNDSNFGRTSTRTETETETETKTGYATTKRR